MPAEIEQAQGRHPKAPDAAAKARLRGEPRPGRVLSGTSSRPQAGAAHPHGRGDDDAEEGGREIRLHVLGRAHTDGDLFIYLPKEKVRGHRRRASSTGCRS